MMWHVLGLKMQFCIKNENNKKRSFVNRNFFPFSCRKQSVCVRVDFGLLFQVLCFLTMTYNGLIQRTITFLASIN